MCVQNNVGTTAAMYTMPTLDESKFHTSWRWRGSAGSSLVNIHLDEVQKDDHTFWKAARTDTYPYSSVQTNTASALVDLISLVRTVSKERRACIASAAGRRTLPLQVQ